jgi:hypothetical protein
MGQPEVAEMERIVSRAAVLIACCATRAPKRASMGGGRLPCVLVAKVSVGFQIVHGDSVVRWPSRERCKTRLSENVAGHRAEWTLSTMACRVQVCHGVLGWAGL